MQTILLNHKQSSILARNDSPVQVCDEAGTLLGRIVPRGQPGNDGWVESWNEWYFVIDEADADNAELTPHETN